MVNNEHTIGFSYFASPDRMVKKQLNRWMSFLPRLGAAAVIFNAGFERAIPEDAFLSAQANGLEPIVHFTAELPQVRKFNDVALLLEVYAKWGCQQIIFGERPNLKETWHAGGWQHDKLIDNFLDRFVPLANHAVRIKMKPGMPPMQPGGDYWDTSFLALVLKGLQARRMDDVIEQLILTSYGFTFNKPLEWGQGGPERWSISKPYHTPEGQEDQLGFHNYEWIQAVAHRSIGRKVPVTILNAGHPGFAKQAPDHEKTLQAIKEIVELKWDHPTIERCIFSLDTLEEILGETFSFEGLIQIFGDHRPSEKTAPEEKSVEKIISHYLLLPLYSSGVSEVVLNKVRPLIKKYHPTVGFSIKEAESAKRVSIFPDPVLFPEEIVEKLKSKGCAVEVLPDSGIEIATNLQEP